MIRRVRLVTTGHAGKPREGVAVRGGTAAFGDIVRVDLYWKAGRYGMAPVYFHDIANVEHPPHMLVRPTEPRKNWEALDDDHEFCFSVYHGTAVKILTRDGVEKTGFVRSFDIFRARLLTNPFDNTDVVEKVGTRMARVICKLNIDRLGRVAEIHREPLLWHGRVVRPKASFQPASQIQSNRAMRVAG